MRGPLATPRSRELSRLCSSARAGTRPAAAAAGVPAALQAPGPFLTTARSMAAPARHHHAPAASLSQRWFSALGPSRAPPPGRGEQQEQEQEEGGRGGQPSARPPKTTHTPLPYYALFPQTLPDGPPPTGPFDIDVRVLRREFLQLQAASHPDFHHHAAAADTETGTDPSSSSPTTTSDPSPSSSSSTAHHSAARRRAEALSSHINAAYKTLSAPLPRAQYLLAERYGIDLAGDEASAHTGPPEPELLIEVLHARETIEDAASEEDLDGVRAENEARIDACLAGLARAFAREDIPAAVRETVRLRYWENIRESVQNWEEGKPVVLQH